jgi:hypothetical protein
MQDPCRPGVRDSVRLCQAAGIKVLSCFCVALYDYTRCIQKGQVTIYVIFHNPYIRLCLLESYSLLSLFSYLFELLGAHGYW